MQLDLKDQIIILDEAHNIEDICRDVASKTIRADEIEEVIKECMNLEKIVHDDILKSTYNTIYDYCQTVLQFLAKQLVAPIVSNFLNSYCAKIISKSFKKIILYFFLIIEWW